MSTVVHPPVPIQFRAAMVVAIEPTPMNNKNGMLDNALFACARHLQPGQPPVIAIEAAEQLNIFPFISFSTFLALYIFRVE